MYTKRLEKRQIVIVGAGLVGSIMALALSLKGFNVSVIDGNSEKKRRVKNNGRTYALSRTSKNLLKNLGLWDPKRLNISFWSNPASFKSYNLTL